MIFIEKFANNLKLFKNIFLSLCLCLITVVSCSSTSDYKFARIKSLPPIKSIVMTGYGSDTYQKEAVNDYIKELKELNLNTASFLYTCITENETSSTINCNTFDTPNLKNFAKTIEIAKKAEMLVSIRHYIDLRNRAWRCHWEPNNSKKFFSEYTKNMIPFVKMLERRKVDILILGSEYCKISGSKYKKQWVKLIREIREHFKGKISYAANTNSFNNSFEYENVSFWNELDFIGLNHYIGLPKRFDISEYSDYQEIMIEQYLKKISRFKKNILITEFGIPGVDKGLYEPYEWRNKGESNEEQQAFAYKTVLNLFKKRKEITGIYIWRKNNSNYKTKSFYNPNETDYDLWHRKAWYEIKNHFKDSN